MAIDSKTRQGIRADLRKRWMYSKRRREQLEKAKVRPGIYQCSECGALVAKSDIQVDHIIPCGKTPGARGSTELDTWDGLIKRMLDDEYELQNLCRQCHDAKTHG